LSAGLSSPIAFFYAILAELKFVVKACFFKQIFSRTNRRKNLRKSALPILSLQAVSQLSLKS